VTSRTRRRISNGLRRKAAEDRIIRIFELWRKIAAFGCKQGFTGRIRVWFLEEGRAAS
jgi:hypothetical protein